MTTDIEELKRLAEPLASSNWLDCDAAWWDSFRSAANPATVLGLIAEIERLRESRGELLGALRGMVQLDRENHQRGDDDIDISQEVQTAYNAIANAEKTK